MALSSKCTALKSSFYAIRKLASFQRKPPAEIKIKGSRQTFQLGNFDAVRELSCNTLQPLFYYDLLQLVKQMEKRNTSSKLRSQSEIKRNLT